MHDDQQKQTEGVHEDMALTTFDFLACVKPAFFLHIGL